MRVLLNMFLLLYLSFSAEAQDTPPFQPMDVFQLEWVENPMISPDGEWIVYQRRGMDIMHDRRTSQLWIIRADGTEHEKLTNRDQSESAAVWSPDSKRLAFVSSKGEGAEIYTYTLKRGKVNRLTQLDRSPSGLSWSPDGSSIAFSMLVPEAEPRMVRPLKKPKGAKWANHPRVINRLKHEADGSGYMEPGFRHYFMVPSEGGSARQITSGKVHHRGAPQWSKNGEYLFFSGNLNEDWAHDFRESEVYRVRIMDGKVDQLTDRKGPDGGLAISPDGSKIAYLGFDDRVQTYQLRQLSIMDADGQNSKRISVDLDRNLSNLTWNANGSALYAQYDDHGATKLARIGMDGSVDVLIDDIGGEAVARPYSGGSYSLSDNGLVAYSQASPYTPARLAIHTPTGSKTLVDLNEDLLPYRELGEVEEIWWKSHVDGRDIQGWLVKPPGFDPDRTYPLLVENHGGPISCYGPYFSPEMQLYAAAGYVVLYPNPRGSTSYGEEFGNLLYHNYPGDDYHDVMDGVDAVLKLGYTSEDSLFVTGGSAGGIMSAWMIGKNNRFRSAAVIKPVMNWISKTLVADNYYGYAHSRYPGQPWENPMEYWKFSPLSLVGNIETPTLVMVGTSDLRTPLSEAKQLYHALKIRKVETALVEMPGAYHFIANRPSQLIMKIEHILAWFDRSR
ncbi:MAG: S9 family peptidase [Saprospiraceae bacterium]|nr:S9 family peptidase [Saprospiraceae bacterium]